MSDPSQAAQVADQAVRDATLAGGTVGGIAALGVLGRLLQILFEWWGKRTAAKLAAETAKAERRARSKSEDITASHKAADKLLQLSDRQTREVERANRERDEAEAEAAAKEAMLGTCEEKYNHLIKRMSEFEHEHAGCPGAAAFSELSGKCKALEEQNEWMENAIVSFTGMTPPRKTVPAPSRVVEALEESKRSSGGS